jgi:hypothetical protein
MVTLKVIARLRSVATLVCYTKLFRIVNTYILSTPKNIEIVHGSCIESIIDFGMGLLSYRY